MKWGTFKAGDARFAANSVQVSRTSGLTAYDYAVAGVEKIAIGELVNNATAAYINGYVGGQQTDGRTMKHAIGAAIMPFNKNLLTTSVALYGPDCGYLYEGESYHQEIPASRYPQYRRTIFSSHVRMDGSSDGTVKLDWGYNVATFTVTSATIGTITDSTDPFAGLTLDGETMILRSGIGQDQEVLVSSNTDSTLTLSAELETIPEAGDTGDVVLFATPTMYRIDTLTGTRSETSTVRVGAGWTRFYVVFDTEGITWQRLYPRITAVSGNMFLDAHKFEQAPVLEAGTSTSAAAGYLIDTDRGWEDNKFNGETAICLDGDNAGDFATITDTDNATSKVTAAFSTTPSSDTTYIIVPRAANCVPTVYTDTSPITAMFGELTAAFITTGDLRIGGGLAERPRFVLENADGQVMMVAGDNVDGTGFRGWKMLRDACMAFYGGHIIMNPSLSAEDTGTRARVSHEGLEAFLDDNLAWGLYSRGGWVLVMRDSELKARLVANTTDGYAAYDEEGASFWGVNPFTKHWHLGRKSDPHRLTYTTETGLVIPGGAITAGTVTASKIAANSITADLIAAGTITGAEISASAKITVGTGNNVAVLDGADGLYRIYAGNATPASAPFYVTQAGYMKSSSGLVGGFTIGSSTLTSGSMVIDSGNKKIFWDASLWIAKKSVGALDFFWVNGKTYVDNDFYASGAISSDRALQLYGTTVLENDGGTMNLLNIVGITASGTAQIGALKIADAKYHTGTVGGTATVLEVTDVSGSTYYLQAGTSYS